jgi:hypothetical protein
MNSKRYQEVFQKHILFWIDNFSSIHFLQDEAFCLTSKRIKDISSGSSCFRSLTGLGIAQF